MSIKEYIIQIMKYFSYTITLILTLIGLYTFFNQMYIDKFGKENENLQIVNVRLVPSHWFFKKEYAFYANSGVAVTVKNLGDTKIQLTSYSMEFNGDKTLHSNATAIGENILGNDPNKTSSIFINEGQEKTFYLSQSLSLDKAMSFFDKKVFLNAFISPIGENTFLLHDLEVSKDFNKLLFEKYKTTSIDIKLYTGNKKLIKEHEIVLSNGSDLFEKNGNFQHNSFLANALSIKQNKNNPNRSFK